MRRHPLIIAVISLVGLVACTSGDEARQSTTSAESTEANDTSTAKCDLLPRFESIYEKLSSPEVFGLDAPELDAVLEERRQAVSELGELTEDAEDAETLRDLADAYADTDPVLLEGWENRFDELSEAGTFWMSAVFDGPGIDGSVRDAYQRSRDMTYPIAGLYAECRAPELLTAPEQDLDTEPESGTIVFNAPSAQGGDLWVIPPTGGDESRLERPTGWDDLRSPVVAPDGETIAAVATRADGSGSALTVGTVTTGFDVIHESEQFMDCPQWSADGTQVFVTAVGDSGNSLRSVRLDGSTEDIDLDLADFYCADSLPDGSLVAGFATTDRQISGGIFSLSADGSTPEVIFRKEDCSHLLGEVSPDGEQIVASLSCQDPLESGLYLVDVGTGTGSQLVTGGVALPRFSPTGDWITFGLAPIGENTLQAVSVWIVAVDGAGLRQVTQPASSFPAWTADGNGSDAPLS